jgi:hypothetical protein
MTPTREGTVWPDSQQVLSAPTGSTRWETM